MARSTSYVEENARNGKLLVLWTKSKGLLIQPWYERDKMRFTAVFKGTHESIDIYMDIQHDGFLGFDDWAYDIIHGRMERILDMEKHMKTKLPEYYAYTTGSYGNKHIGICNLPSDDGLFASKYMIILAVADENNKKSASFPISFHDLRKLAERYQLTYRSRKYQLAKYVMDYDYPSQKQ